MKKINEWLLANRYKEFSIVIGGHIFGGRYGESPQNPKSLERTDDILKFYFNTTEKLIIKKPKLIFSFFGNLCVPFASEVIWGWHYYGHDQIPENWCEEVYRRKGFEISVTRKGPIKEVMPENERWKQNSLSFIAITKLM